MKLTSTAKDVTLISTKTKEADILIAIMTIAKIAFMNTTPTATTAKNQSAMTIHTTPI